MKMNQCLDEAYEESVFGDGDDKVGYFNDGSGLRDTFTLTQQFGGSSGLRDTFTLNQKSKVPPFPGRDTHEIKPGTFSAGKFSTHDIVKAAAAMAAEQASKKVQQKSSKCLMPVASSKSALPESIFHSVEEEEELLLQRLAGFDHNNDTDPITGSRMSTDQSGCTRLFLQSGSTQGQVNEVPVDMVQLPVKAVAKVAAKGPTEEFEDALTDSASLTAVVAEWRCQVDKENQKNSVNNNTQDRRQQAIAKVDQAAGAHYRSLLFRDRLRETIVIDAVLHPEGMYMHSLFLKKREQGHDYDPHGFKAEVKGALYAGHCDYLALRNHVCGRLNRLLEVEEKRALTQILSMAGKNKCLYNNYPRPKASEDNKLGRGPGNRKGQKRGMGSIVNFLFPASIERQKRRKREDAISSDKGSDGDVLDAPKKKNVRIDLGRNVMFINPRKPKFAGWKTHY